MLRFPVPPYALQSQQPVALPEIAVDAPENCIERYKGRYFGIQLQSLVDSTHFISSGIVSFARGQNDTPKIVAFLVLFS